MENTILFGQYEIESTIGAGGMAVVYKARHKTLGKYFAIKKLSDSLTQNSDARERFIREAQTHSKLDHPNIVKFHDILKDPTSQNVFIVMEYVEGKTLSQIIGKVTGPMPFERAWPIFKQVLSGIGYAHSLGVVHRDIKPSNIIVTAEGVVKILDFGIARDETGQTLTQSGTVIGTLQYASPEQIKGEKIDQRSDIYSLGMTLYEMLSGRLPLDINTGTSSYHVMQTVLKESVPDPRTFYPHITEKIVAAIFMAIEKDHAKRIGSVEDFVAVLEGKKGVSGIPVLDSLSDEKFEKVYSDLLMIQRSQLNFLVFKRDEGTIDITNGADGYKVLRVIFVILACFFGLLLFGSIGACSDARRSEQSSAIISTFIIAGLFGSCIWGYMSLRFRQNFLSITRSGLNFHDLQRHIPIKLSFSEIYNIRYSSGKRAVMVQGKRMSTLLFQNSKKAVLSHLAMILNQLCSVKK
mgnify:CR=1 FL=1